MSFYEKNCALKQINDRERGDFAFKNIFLFLEIYLNVSLYIIISKAINIKNRPTKICNRPIQGVFSSVQFKIMLLFIHVLRRHIKYSTLRPAIIVWRVHSHIVGPPMSKYAFKWICMIIRSRVWVDGLKSCWYSRKYCQSFFPFFRGRYFPL